MQGQSDTPASGYPVSAAAVKQSHTVVLRFGSTYEGRTHAPVAERGELPAEPPGRPMLRRLCRDEGQEPDKCDHSDPGFVPVAGKRFVDTRSGLGAPKATIAPGKSVDIQVTGANDVPAGASGAVVNLIAINSTSSDGNLTPYATGGTKPQNSLHYTPSATTSIQAQVALSADGKMTIANSSSTVNLVIDLQGYFTAAGQTGAVFTPGTGRAYDSRATGNTILAKNETRSIQIAGTAGVPVMGSGITAGRSAKRRRLRLHAAHRYRSDRDACLAAAVRASGRAFLTSRPCSSFGVASTPGMTRSRRRHGTLDDE